MSTTHTVKEFIVQNFLFGEEGRVNEDTSFLSSNIIDSTGMLELAGFLEERYGISIEDDELIPENLDSLRNIARFLGKKLDTAEPAVKDRDQAARNLLMDSKPQAVETNLPII